jgi:hypothetical protein
MMVYAADDPNKLYVAPGKSRTKMGGRKPGKPNKLNRELKEAVSLLAHFGHGLRQLAWSFNASRPSIRSHLHRCSVA